jgi:hypothetical protein
MTKTLDGKMLGIKSFEYKVWKSALRTALKEKKIRAKELLNRIRNRPAPAKPQSETPPQPPRP